MITPQSKFWYDALYRLVKATGRELSSLNAPDYGDFANNIPVPNPSANAMQNYTQLFVYDELGNIQSMSSQNRWTRTYNYSNPANNYLSSTQVGQDVFSYTYDIHGNMTSMPHLPSMQWDFADRLREVELNLSGDTAYYIYDSTGNRCRKVVEKGSIREERYYLEGYEVFRKFISGDLDFERQTLHVSDDTKKFATLETKTINNATPVNPIVAEIKYQYDNHLGSACLELDQTAQIISYEEYHPFGTTSYRSGRSETETSLKRYKYVGKERDEETGLYYYGARYYAAWICRFVSVDPLQFEYPNYTPNQYAGNKPISYIDLDGLEELKKGTTGVFKRIEKINSINKKTDFIVSKSIKSDTRDATLEMVSKLWGEWAEKKAIELIQKNKKNGIKVDNYGRTVKSKSEYVNKEMKKLRGEDTWKDIGYERDGFKITTRNMGNETKGIKLFKLLSKEAGELIGPIMDLVTIGNVLQGKENAAAIINPVSFVLEMEFLQFEQKSFEISLKKGFESTKNYIKNCRSCDDKELSWLYLSEEEYVKVMNGDINEESKLASINRTERLGFAVLIRPNENNVNKFNVVASFILN